MRWSLSHKNVSYILVHQLLDGVQIRNKEWAIYPAFPADFYNSKLNYRAVLIYNNEK